MRPHAVEALRQELLRVPAYDDRARVNHQKNVIPPGLPAMPFSLCTGDGLASVRQFHPTDCRDRLSYIRVTYARGLSLFFQYCSRWSQSYPPSNFARNRRRSSCELTGMRLRE